MSEDIETIAIRATDLRKMLQQFNEDLGQHMNAEERFKLGRVLTIIDAAIADPEQRKAIKDLVHNEWWNTGRLTESPMVNPHTDMRAICLVLGFELYPATDIMPAAATASDEEEWATKRYRDMLKTRK